MDGNTSCLRMRLLLLCRRKAAGAHSGYDPELLLILSPRRIVIGAVRGPNLLIIPLIKL